MLTSIIGSTVRKHGNLTNSGHQPSVILPRNVQSNWQSLIVRRLHCQQPSFGSACCLAKRWLAAQLIDDSHMPDVAVELLMASLYLNSDVYQPASAPQVAFLRFLEAFAREHWSTDPIIVNFNNGMTREYL